MAKHSPQIHLEPPETIGVTLGQQILLAQPETIAVTRGVPTHSVQLGIIVGIHGALTPSGQPEEATEQPVILTRLAQHVAAET